MHMDDFEKLLKTELSRLLDPIVDAASAPPLRRRHRSAAGSLRAVAGGLGGIPTEVVLVEPVAVPVAVSTTAGTPAS